MVSVASYFVTTRQALHSTAEYRLETLADWETKLVRSWFNERMTKVRILANSPEVVQMNLPGVRELFARTLKYSPEFKLLAFINQAGISVVDTSGNKDTIVTDREYFKRTIKGNEHISELIISRHSNKPSIAFSCPVRVNGKVAGVIVGLVEVDTLNEMVMGFTIGKTGENLLIDRNGNLITIPESMAKSGINPNIINKAPQSNLRGEGLWGPEGPMSYTDYRGVSIIGYRKWLPDLKILLITKQDQFEAMEKAGGVALKSSLAIGTGLILLIFPIVWVLARRIATPLETITTAVNQIASGNLSYRVQYTKSNEEIERLSFQINDLAETLQVSQNLISQQMAELEAQKQSIVQRNEDILRAYEDLTEANKNLRLMATTDQLTQICNRRYFLERLRSEVFISLRTKRPLSLALLDIDHFKTINDTYGHKTGDEVLKGIVQVTTSVIRRSDLLARFGGEEFVLLTPETNLQGGLVLAEKIRSAVACHNFEVEGKTINVNLSVGVSELHNFSDSPDKIEDELIQAADYYLYEAKHNGRNRVEGGHYNRLQNESGH